MEMSKALIIVDVQKAFQDPKWGNRNNPDAESKINSLLLEWRKRKLEVIFIKHLSTNPNSVFYHKNESSQINDLLYPLPTETIFTKEVNSSFIGTSLEDYLHQLKINELVLTGLTTPHCVSTTARMSGNLGFTTYLLSDATAAFDLTDHLGNRIDAQTVHDVSLATIHNEFATVITTEDYIKLL
ncbi:cysteine hydrolase family protein [Metabacillus litoralis]|uniref:cysteine hydrolase family protein n=1 Tax=Metabacillus litoralis TaxID=152268 RepID=UPI000EF5D4E8|nr:cysteine hydrolase family protein [Metabacillus litoralis]